jgi:hypothetical protein
MHRQADRLGLVGQRALDGLLDPPRAVGREFAALGRIKPLHRLHQADIPFADQVQQWQPDPFIIARDFHHQPQVGLDHLLAGFLVPLLDLAPPVRSPPAASAALPGQSLQVQLDGGVPVVAASFPPGFLKTPLGELRSTFLWIC